MKLFYVLPFLVFLVSRISGITCCFDSERAALLSFKSNLIDPSDRLSLWQGRNCCAWYGIRCSRSFRVVAVDLRNPNPDSFTKGMNTALMGNISSSLFTLTYISHLDLSFNNFMFSRIPTAISNLTRLTYLNLSNANFSDSITTQFANLTSLKKLDLSCASVTGPFSFRRSYMNFGFLSSSNLDWLKGKYSLRELVLSGVDLSKASKFASWANPLSVLSNMRSLHLSDCKIFGETPINQLRNLTHLSILKMDFNPFTWKIPDWFSNLTSLSVLDLSNSNLQGPIHRLTQVRELYVANSYITVDLQSMFMHPWPLLETLDISSARVVGSIPPSLGNVTSLVNFIAYNCVIEGSIPSSFANLSRLEILVLDLNRLMGHIPSWISNLRSLKKLYLAENSLEGTIPESICDISSLMLLALQNNFLTGTLPDCIRHMPNLERLYVSENKLGGTIQLSATVFKSPISVLHLGYNNLKVEIDEQSPPNSSFESLDLSVCQIEGRIPDFLSNMTQLQTLALVGNQLSGTIPSWLLNLPRLSFLDLSFNRLQGFLPSSIRLSPVYSSSLILVGNFLQGHIPSVFENIEAINLSSNNFTGSMPPNTQLGNALFFSISGNKLFGQISPSLCKKQSSLEFLDLSDNILSGPIPNSLGNCTSLLFLRIRQNNLSGQVPVELQNAENLSYLDLSDNQFEGSFPSFVEKLTSLSILNIGNNKFIGKIPTFIGELRELQILVLRSNSFNESIPRELNNLQQLQFLDLSDNALIGHIPERLDGLTLLRNQTTGNELIAYKVSGCFSRVTIKMVIKGQVYEYVKLHTYNTGMDLSLNALTGNIPSEITLLKGLTMLNLSYNNLSGEIPGNIGEMKTLQSLDLKFNDLSGKIPKSMNLLDSLGALNLSYNNFSGNIHELGRKMDTFDNDNGSTYIGNMYLCGAPGAINCNIPSASLPNQESVSNEEEDEDKLILIVTIIIAYFIGLWGYFGVLYVLKEPWKERYWQAVDGIVSRIIRFMHVNR